MARKLSVWHISIHVLWISKTRRGLFQRSSAVRASNVIIFIIVIGWRTVVVGLRAKHVLLVHLPRRLLTHVATVTAQSTHFLQQLKTSCISASHQLQQPYIKIIRIQTFVMHTTSSDLIILILHYIAIPSEPMLLEWSDYILHSHLISKICNAHFYVPAACDL